MTFRERIGQASPALKFVVLVGVMSFFADFTYEGSRSIIGPYLGMLGAGALAIAIITGAGEFLGYGLRLVSGRSADRTGRYWPITIGGYVLQMSVVPLLALAGSWHGLLGRRSPASMFRIWVDTGHTPALRMSCARFCSVTGRLPGLEPTSCRGHSWDE